MNKITRLRKYIYLNYEQKSIRLTLVKVTKIYTNYLPKYINLTINT